MKKSRIKSGIATLLSIGLFACAPTKETTSSQSSAKVANVKESAVLWQQTAAEYTALCFQAFNIAQLRIQNMPEDALASSKPPAVIFDLDETVLDNSPYNGYMILKNRGYEPASWAEWTSLEEAALVPGALEFINYLQEKGIMVYFISNRKTAELQATINNLNKLGVPNAKDKILLRKDSREKDQRRAQVANDYNIIMLVGDNLADFHNIFEEDLTITERKKRAEKFRTYFGDKFIVLPNPMYGDWERTLKQNDPEATHQQDKKGARKYIKGF